MIKVDKSSILNRERRHKYLATLCYIIYTAGMQKIGFSVCYRISNKQVKQQEKQQRKTHIIYGDLTNS